MVSMEPLLEHVKVPLEYLVLGSRAWVIVGGESGTAARSFNLGWAQMIVEQCAAAGVACFVKQLGTQFAIGKPTWSTAKRRDRKGGDMEEWPQHLRVREFPTVSR